MRAELVIGPRHPDERARARLDEYVAQLRDGVDVFAMHEGGVTVDRAMEVVVGCVRVHALAACLDDDVLLVLGYARAMGLPLSFDLAGAAKMSPVCDYLVRWACEPDSLIVGSRLPDSASYAEENYVGSRAQDGNAVMLECLADRVALCALEIGNNRNAIRCTRMWKVLLEANVDEMLNDVLVGRVWMLECTDTGCHALRAYSDYPSASLLVELVGDNTTGIDMPTRVRVTSARFDSGRWVTHGWPVVVSIEVVVEDACEPSGSNGV